MACSICKQEGHNKTTCRRRNNSSNTLVNTTLRSFGYSTRTNNSTSGTEIFSGPNLIIPIPLLPPKTLKPDSKPNIKIGHNNYNSHMQKVSDKSKSLHLSEDLRSTSTAKNKTYLGSKVLSKGKIIEEKDKDVVSKIQMLPKLIANVDTRHTITVSNFCKGCHKQEHPDISCNVTKPEPHTMPEHDRYSKTCGVCNQPHHNRATCPLSQEEREEKKAISKTSKPYWLTPIAQRRFESGPTPKDGKGYIYIYTFKDPKTDEERSLFKIGYSEDLPERRVKCQQSRNGEIYHLLFSEGTPYRKLTENVIHLNLHEVRRPREHGDGKTEWFTGDRNHFEEVIKRVIKEVRFCDFTQNS